MGLHFSPSGGGGNGLISKQSAEKALISAEGAIFFILVFFRSGEWGLNLAAVGIEGLNFSAVSKEGHNFSAVSREGLNFTKEGVLISHHSAEESLHFSQGGA